MMQIWWIKSWSVEEWMAWICLASMFTAVIQKGEALLWVREGGKGGVMAQVWRRGVSEAPDSKCAGFEVLAPCSQGSQSKAQGGVVSGSRMGGGGIVGGKQRRQRSSADSILGRQHSCRWGWRGVRQLWSGVLSLRCVSFAVLKPHLVPGGLPVQDGTQAPEAGVWPHLNTVGRRLSWLRCGRLHGTDVISGLVRPPPPQVRQVGKAQLFRLRGKRRKNIWLHFIKTIRYIKKLLLNEF